MKTLAFQVLGVATLGLLVTYAVSVHANYRLRRWLL